MRIEGAIIGVGLLMLERIPRGLLVTEETLKDQYEPALQEFQDTIALHGHTLEPPVDFRQRTSDHVLWFLEDKGYLK